MAQTPLRQLFRTAADHAANYRASLDDRRVGPSKTADEVLEELVSVADGGLVSTAGPRYFGFVIGGALPAASAAEILATGWDQNAWSTVLSPTAAAAEQSAGSWLKELLGLPPTVSAGFVTGAQAANTVGLAAARHHVLAKAGWDVEVDGLNGAPRVRILVGDERHASIDRSLRLLGFGSRSIELVRTKANGVIDLDDLQRLLEQQAPGPTTPTSAHPDTSAGASAPSAGASAPSAEPARREQGPLIVCLQAGNVNTGASDSLGDACRIVHEYGGWVHVDGAFGLWAAASPAVRDQVAGLEQADSWGCDGHKWLNLPYDSGFVFCAYPDSHAAALAYSASYLLRSEEREPGVTRSIRRDAVAVSRSGPVCRSSAGTA